MSATLFSTRLEGSGVHRIVRTKKCVQRTSQTTRRHSPRRIYLARQGIQEAQLLSPSSFSFAFSMEIYPNVVDWEKERAYPLMLTDQDEHAKGVHSWRIHRMTLSNRTKYLAAGNSFDKDARQSHSLRLSGIKLCGIFCLGIVDMRVVSTGSFPWFRWTQPTRPVRLPARDHRTLAPR
jgi:hypothetical protein